MISVYTSTSDETEICGLYKPKRGDTGRGASGDPPSFLPLIIMLAIGAFKVHLKVSEQCTSYY